MFDIPNQIPTTGELYDEVYDYGMMCNDSSPVGFNLEHVEDDKYVAKFQMMSSFEHNVDENRFKEIVEDCHYVTDDNFDYIQTESEPEFEKEFDMIKGTYEVSINQGESQEQ